MKKSFLGLEELEGLVCEPAQEEEGKEGEADSDFTGCGGEGDALWEWLNVTGGMVTTEKERKQSDGRIPFDGTDPWPGP